MPRVVLILVAAVSLLALSACAPRASDVSGAWESVDGARLELATDGTFTLDQMPTAFLHPDILDPDVFATDSVDGLHGTWYVESPFENPFPDGFCVILDWETEQLAWLKTGLYGTTHAGNLTLSLPLRGGGDVSELYTFAAVAEDGP